MKFSNLPKLQIEKFVLNKISQEDKSFIESIFIDVDVKKYYIVPKEAQQNYKMLIGYWLEDIQNEAGYAWIITEKGNSTFQPDKKCGFIAFEFRNTTSNARVSYALLPQFRDKGIIGKCLAHVLEALKEIGVQTVEADIDRDNLASEKVVEKLGFTANKKKALIDVEMMREGEIRIRALWVKQLNAFSKADFFIMSNSTVSQLFNSQAQTQFKTFEVPQTMGEYCLLFESDVTEQLVGVSSKTDRLFRVPWELLREEQFGGNKYLIFRGWGNGISGRNTQFNNHEIGIEKRYFANIVAQLMSINPIMFSLTNMKKVVGLEGFKFENGQITI